MFTQAAHDENSAREQLRDTLQPRQAALSSAVSRLLVQNNEAEEDGGTNESLRSTGGYSGNCIFPGSHILAISLTSFIFDSQ